MTGVVFSDSSVLSLLASNPQLSIHQHEHVMKMDQTVLIIHLRVQNLRTFNEIDKHNHGTAWNWRIHNYPHFA